MSRNTLLIVLLSIFGDTFSDTNDTQVGWNQTYDITNLPFEDEPETIKKKPIGGNSISLFSVDSIAENVNLVKFLLYRDRKYQDRYKLIDINNVDVIVKSTKFKNDRPLVILIHGFLNNWQSEMPQQIKNELFKYLDVDVIIVEWGHLSGAYLPRLSAIPQYPTSLKNTFIVGKQVGRLIVELMKATNRKNADNVHLIGFSLGAHIAGVAGYQVYAMSNKKVGRITGLDPAGPGFNYLTMDSIEYLDKEDAQFVDVIHTNAWGLGHSSPIGNVDIYPDGGVVQEACLLQSPGCSHSESVKIFIESIRSKPMACYSPCQPWEYHNPFCKWVTVYCPTFGYYQSPMDLEGGYFVENP